MSPSIRTSQHTIDALTLSSRAYGQINRSTGTVEEEKHNGIAASGTSSWRSWRASSVMLIGLMFGFSFALAHHMMNTSLHQKPANSTSQPSQAWISRFSTALAFLAQSFLVLTVGAAFVQRQWLNLHQKPIKIKEVDAMVGILGSVFNFFSTLWFKYPFLALMALVSWTIPIAAVITPGSLSVVPFQSSNSTSLKVPQISFNNTLYGITRFAQGTLMHSENDQVSQLVHATLSGQNILPIQSENQNQSYSLEFFGPALKCIQANDSVVNNFMAIYNETHRTVPYDATFISWVPGDLNNTMVDRAIPQKLDIDSKSPTGAGLFIMSETGSILFNESARRIFTECRLHNASYKTEFQFHYPRQTITIQSLQHLNPVSYPALSLDDRRRDWNPEVLDHFDIEPFAYLALMSGFNKLLVGRAEVDYYNDRDLFATSYNLLNVNWTSSEQIISGLEQAFQNITLSLYSNSHFFRDPATWATASVLVTSYPSTYIYDPFDLLLPYGIALGAALFCCALGFHAVFVSKSSYQNVFSTFLRATNDLDRLWIEPGDNGADPLPKELAKQTVYMSKGRTSSTSS